MMSRLNAASINLRIQIIALRQFNEKKDCYTNY